MEGVGRGEGGKGKTNMCLHIVLKNAYRKQPRFFWRVSPLRMGPGPGHTRLDMSQFGFAVKVFFWGREFSFWGDFWDDFLGDFF